VCGHKNVPERFSNASDLISGHRLKYIPSDRQSQSVDKKFELSVECIKVHT
jgi:hypothetical protein